MYLTWRCRGRRLPGLPQSPSPGLGDESQDHRWLRCLPFLLSEGEAHGSRRPGRHPAHPPPPRAHPFAVVEGPEPAVDDLPAEDSGVRLHDPPLAPHAGHEAQPEEGPRDGREELNRLQHRGEGHARQVQQEPRRAVALEDREQPVLKVQLLAAVEDFMAERNLGYAHLPGVFGLGMLWSRSAHWATELADLLAPFDRNPLLERLERNRLELYLRVLALQDDLTRQAVRHDRAVAAYEAKLAGMNADNAALRLRLAEVEPSVASST